MNQKIVMVVAIILCAVAIFVAGCSSTTAMTVPVTTAMFGNNTITSRNLTAPGNLPLGII